ncbi:unnamed protein product [Linum trigynum]|uniref:Retrotransposon gag domain-containing protein n=1 Tax=Linum trigynum TaxID=586398 RepID=A0AAV2F880_9ROSI
MRSPIQHPQVPANNFEVSTSIITMLRGSAVFYGKSGECPRAHLRRFHELIDGIKNNEVQAKMWLDNQPSGSISTFTNLTYKFLTRYHLPSKTADLQKEITHFAQEEDETIQDAWERDDLIYTHVFIHHSYTV